MLQAFGRTVRELGLEVNVDKTKLLIAKEREEGEQEEMYIDGEKVEEVEVFEYLGGHVARRNAARRENSKWK